jgi:hypothetical protein
MIHTYSFYDMRDALAQPGCPVCRLKAEYVEQFIGNLLYEKVNDPGLRDRIRAARGFCHEHAWELARRGAALGVAIILRDVLEEIQRHMTANLSESASALGRLRRSLSKGRAKAAAAQLLAALDPQEPCMICALANEAEQRYLDALREHLLGEEGLLALYAASDGLCLPHFRQALAHLDGPATFGALVEAQRAIWDSLDWKLSEAIRKSDYRFSHEPSGDEAGSWLRAIAALAGEPKQPRG